VRPPGRKERRFPAVLGDQSWINMVKGGRGFEEKRGRRKRRGEKKEVRYRGGAEMHRRAAEEDAV